MTTENITAPETPISPEEGNGAAAPPEEDVVGELTVGEMRALEVQRQRIQTITQEVGNLEVRKAALINRLTEIEAHGQQILQGAAKRLGIPPGESWSVSITDGKVRRTPPS